MHRGDGEDNGASETSTGESDGDRDDAVAPAGEHADPVESSHSVDDSAATSDETRSDGMTTAIAAVTDEHESPDADDGPALPASEPAPAAPMTQQAPAGAPANTTWYRTDDDRNRSVNRLANPWYRRVARGLILMSFIALAGIGLYFGARLVQDWLDRDRLPAAGAEVPEIRSTSVEIRSASPAPTLDGTLTLDTQTNAFEFTGRGNGTQAGLQIVSPDGQVVYIRQNNEPWREATNENVAADARRAVDYLSNDDNADDILTSQLRRGYVDLIEQTEVGTGNAQITRYEVRLDTDSFSDDFPLQFREFQDRAIPGVGEVRGLVVIFAIDTDDVLVEVNDDTTNWVWQRLTYSDQPFRPIDPASDLLDSTIQITDGSLGNDDS